MRFGFIFVERFESVEFGRKPVEGDRRRRFSRIDFVTGTEFEKESTAQAVGIRRNAAFAKVVCQQQRNSKVSPPKNCFVN